MASLLRKHKTQVKQFIDKMKCKSCKKTFWNVFNSWWLDGCCCLKCEMKLFCKEYFEHLRQRGYFNKGEIR